ncbi:hypothetical protein AB7M35_001696 [Amorphus suaedae]
MKLICVINLQRILDMADSNQRLGDLPLPLVPHSIRSAFHVDERADSRFTGCARLLQALWREARCLPMGRRETSNGKTRLLGSLLSPEAARAGAAFLTPDIARITWRECAYREPGALIEEERLWGNLLSSQGLTFNLFALARTDRNYATAVFSALAPETIGEVQEVRFEHSPGRGKADYIGDHTALDLVVRGLSPDGRPAILGIEVKYAEQSGQAYRRETEVLIERSREAGLHRDVSGALFRDAHLAQFAAEHLLTYCISKRMDESVAGAFMVIAPEDNAFIQSSCDRYEEALTEGDGAVAFMNVSLERCIDVIGEAGWSDLGALLSERYADFSPVHALIDEWEPTFEHPASTGVTK